MYKLMAIDLDDTLLTDDLQISSATKDALTQAENIGVIITLATGRMYASAAAVARQLNLNVPLITYQGALVKNAIDGAVLYERLVPANVAQQVYEYCLANDLHLQAYVNDKLYVAEVNDKVLSYCAISKIDYQVEPDFMKMINQPQTKMLIIDEPAKLDAVAEEMRELFGAKAHITKSKPNFLEIMHPEGTKGNALRFLASHFGCSMEETIAIGDSWNDRDMIEAAGLGVAMDNAVEPLKQLADYVTSSNNQDGVKQVIDNFLLKDLDK